MTKTKEQLLQKLFNNSASEEELRLLFNLIQKDKEEVGPEIMLELLEQMGKVPTLKADTSQRIFNKVSNAINQPAKKAKAVVLQPRRSFLFIRKVAAAVLLLMAVGWSIYQWSSPKMLLAATTNGEIRKIDLPDGSIVTLNENSTIHYPTDWSKGETRKVKLKGEAYFEIEKKISTNAKFQVITKDLTVEVFGTVFNVNTRHKTTKVYLEEGIVKVNLENKNSSVLQLKPGELITYSVEKNLLERPQKIKNELQTSWKERVFTFEDTSLKEILEKLANTYNFEFEFEEKVLAERKFRVSLPKDNMELALSILTKTIKMEIIPLKENKFIIKDIIESENKE